MGIPTNTFMDSNALVAFFDYFKSQFSLAKNRIILSVLFGAVGGPLAYLAGESLGAITVTNPQTIIILAAGWAIITPMLIRQSEKTW
jgi:hypothetical protein